jgi:hypothetical protein
VQVRLVARRRLRFDDGAPVRAASAVVPHAGGLLVAQDDATSAALVRDGRVTRLRLLPPVGGHDVFDDASGTKHLKPDLEAAVALDADRALLLASGSSPGRTRVVLVEPAGVTARDLPDLYTAVQQALGLPPGVLNLEGACRVGDRLRWFSRTPPASVDVGLEALLAAVRTGGAVPVDAVHRYDLGGVDGVALGITDAVALPGGRVLASAAAEDTADPVDDGPVVAAELVVLDGERVVARAPLPGEGAVDKVEGLALRGLDAAGADVVAVVDDDDPASASLLLELRLTW